MAGRETKEPLEAQVTDPTILVRNLQESQRRTSRTLGKDPQNTVRGYPRWISRLLSWDF